MRDWRWRPGERFTINTRSWQADGLVALYPAWHLPVPAGLLDALGLTPLTATGGPGLTGDPQFGHAATFDGSGQYFLSTRALVEDEPLTLTAWARKTATSAERIMVSIANGASTNQFWSLGVEATTGTVAMTTRTSAGTRKALTTTAITAGQWFHAVGTTDTTASRAAYLNGGSKGTNTESSVSWTPTRIGIGVLARSAADLRWDGALAEIRIYNRVLSDQEVAALYAEQTRWELYAPARRRVWFVPAGAATYTGSGAPTLPALVGTGTGTFTAPQYTGTGTPALPTITGAGAGTFTAPTYAGTGAPALPAATATGTGTFTAPTYTGTGAPLLPAATAAGSGVFTAPVYTGSGAPVLPALTGSGTGLFAADIYSGAGVAPLPAVVAAGAGAFTAPTYTGAGAPILPALVGAGLGAFSAPVYTGSGSAALSAITGAGVGTFTPGIAYTPGGRQVEYVPAQVRRMEVAQRTRLARIAARIRSREAT